MPFLWEKLLRPLAFAIEAERAHELGLDALKLGLASPFYCDNVDPILSRSSDSD